MKVDLDYDLKDVKSGFEALPTDQYEAKINPGGVEFKKSQSGKNMLTFWWEITSGEYAGRRIPDNVLLETDWKVKQYCELVGIESGVQLDTKEFEGLEAILTVKFIPEGEKGAPPGRSGNNISKIDKIS
jgi:hypothetical protein